MKNKKKARGIQEVWELHKNDRQLSAMDKVDREGSKGDLKYCRGFVCDFGIALIFKTYHLCKGEVISLQSVSKCFL